MTAIQIITNLFGLITGIGVFLMSIKLIGNHLEYVGGNNLKLLFAKTSKSNTLGVGIGVVSTALIQSSGATSVMAIGFVSAGIMSVMQACSIVLGANIGTTITGQIAAIGFLGGSSMISASTILAVLACVGALMLFFGKKEMTKQVGGLIAGFGLLFVGLSLMSSSMKPFAEVESVKKVIASITFPGYSIVLVLIGIALTAIMQSSSVTSSLAITMYMSNLITLDQGIYLILGSNVGAVIVALIAAMGSNTNAKRVAFFHLITNVIRVFLSLAIIEIVIAAGNNSFTLGSLFELIFPDSVKALRLSMFHTFYNLITVAIMVPFIPAFVKMSEKAIKAKETDNGNQFKLYYLDARLMKNPAIAVQQVKNEVMNMAQIATHNVDRAINIICTQDYEELEMFRQEENEINFLNKEITKFVVQLSKQDLVDKDHSYLSTVYHTVTDIERIGDYAENIIEYAQKLQSINATFSESAIEEIHALHSLVNELYGKIMLAYNAMDEKQFNDAYLVEQKIDIVCDEMAENHIQRLSDGECQADIGAQFLSFTSDTERIADHWLNVGKVVNQVKGNAKQSFLSH